jgi:murein DD-endopeptidase MepM/ murein hydrolase activator NlpD
MALAILYSCCPSRDGPGAWAQPASAEAVRAPQYFPPLDRPPLDPPLRLSGSFGEYRPGHFHAGLDFATGGQVGEPVYASLPGRVVRVRASGTGYGRSVYLQADDGRLLVYGHLDAFDEPLASYVAEVQDSAGEYEQDLWPDPARFRLSAGQRLGWSGRSGTGAPHLHFEPA